MDYRRLLLDHLDEVDRIVTAVGRRRHLSAEDAGDLRSYVHMRLLEHDCAILRQFANRSRLATFLAVVIDRLATDFLAEQWGRWRPSAAAARLGRTAVLLEQLITRDRYSLDEACEVARARYGIAESDAALRLLWEQIPPRPAPGVIAAGAAADVGEEAAADRTIDDQEREADARAIDVALRRAIEARSNLDRLLLALRYDEDLGLHEIAAIAGLPPASLQRRLKRMLRELGVSLAAAGITRERLARVVGHPRHALSPLLRALVRK